MKKLILASAIAAFAFAAQASDLSYSYVGVGYSDGEIEDVDFDGFDINGSIDINDTFFALASYQAHELDESGINLDIDQAEIGVGFHTPLSEAVDLVGTLAYQNIDIDLDIPELGSASDDFNGYGLGLGLRWLVSNNVELNAGLEYRDVEEAIDGEVGYKIGGRYMFDNLSVGLGYSTIDIIEDANLKMEAYRIDLRYDF